MKTLILILLFASKSLAQCEAFDSLYVAQSNEIVRLKGEVKGCDSQIRTLGEMFELTQKSNKIVFDWQETRLEKEREDKHLYGELFIGWVILSTILFIIVK